MDKKKSVYQYFDTVLKVFLYCQFHRNRSIVITVGDKVGLGGFEMDQNSII